MARSGSGWFGTAAWIAYALTELELASDERKDLGTVTPPRCGTLTVTLRHPNGSIAGGASPRLRSALLSAGANLGPALKPSSDGSWHAARVPTGTWWVVVGGDGVAPDAQEVVIAPDVPHQLAFDLAPAVAVELVLTAGGASAGELGQRRETVRRSGDRAVVRHLVVMGPLDTQHELAPGSYIIEIETAGGFHGHATFRVPSDGPIEIALARR